MHSWHRPISPSCDKSNPAIGLWAWKLLTVRMIVAGNKMLNVHPFTKTLFSSVSFFHNASGWILLRLSLEDYPQYMGFTAETVRTSNYNYKDNITILFRVY